MNAAQAVTAPGEGQGAETKAALGILLVPIFFVIGSPVCIIGAYHKPDREPRRGCNEPGPRSLRPRSIIGAAPARTSPRSPANCAACNARSVETRTTPPSLIYGMVIGTAPRMHSLPLTSKGFRRSPRARLAAERSSRLRGPTMPWRVVLPCSASVARGFAGTAVRGCRGLACVARRARCGRGGGVVGPREERRGIADAPDVFGGARRSTVLRLDRRSGSASRRRQLPAAVYAATRAERLVEAQRPDGRAPDRGGKDAAFWAGRHRASPGRRVVGDGLCRACRDRSSG